MKIFLNYILFPLVFLIVGIYVGIIIRDFPKFTLDYNLKITGILKLILTFGIGVFVPLIIKKIIDDKRTFKSILIEEASSFNKIASRINDQLNTIRDSGKLTQQDKNYFVLLFEIGDLEFNQLCDFITEHSNAESKIHIKTLRNKYIEYWKTLTGSEINSDSIKKISDETYKKASKLFADIKTHTRKIKVSINKM